MPTCAEVLAATLRDAGVERMFGLPGGEILDFIDAARKVGIEFVLTRHEAVAAFMADAAGQIARQPAVCVSTLGPGALNLTLGVANAFLDRSPLLAITATMSTAARPFATHQQLDLNAVFRPFTKETMTLDGVNTAATVRRAWRRTLEPRFGPVHLALPSDVARQPDRQAEDPAAVALSPDPPRVPSDDATGRMAGEIAKAQRPVLILGLDLNPYTDAAPLRRFAESVGAPVFVTPKAKGMFPEDHPLFYGVCGGLAADAVIVEFFAKADLLVGVGFDPVESDNVWHRTMKLVSIAPVTIASGDYRPPLEMTGDLTASLTMLGQRSYGPYGWTRDDERAFRDEMEQRLQGRDGLDGKKDLHGQHAPASPADPAHPAHPAHGLSPLAVTRRLRDLFPPETIVTTDVGSIKSIVSQAWRATQPMTFLESNGLSAMGYALPAAMAAKLAMPDRPVLCTMGDGGFGMVFADLETCVRRRIAFIAVVYNDNALSLIQVAQQRRGHVDYGVRYGSVDFAAAAAALGAWSRRVETLDELDRAVTDARRLEVPAVIEVAIDPTEYHAHAR
jgi:acetolactate synthase I/II/III large subunit